MFQVASKPRVGNMGRMLIPVLASLTVAAVIGLGLLANIASSQHTILALAAILAVPTILSLPPWRNLLLWCACYALVPLLFALVAIPWKISGIRTVYIPFVFLATVSFFSLARRRHLQSDIDRAENPVTIDKVSIAFLLVLLITLLIVGRDYVIGFTYWGTWAVYIIFVYHGVVNSLTNEVEIRKVLGAYVISVAFVALYGLLNFFVFKNNASVVIGKTGGTDVTIINLNESVWMDLVTLPLVICCAFSKEFSPRMRTIFRVAGVIIFLHLMFSDARWAYFSLALAFSISIFAPLRRKLSDRGRITRVALVIIMAALLLYSFYPAVNQPIKSLVSTLGRVFKGSTGSIGPGESDFPRLGLLRASSEILHDHWLLGVGVGNYWLYFPSQYVSDVKVPATPHNFYIRVLAEAGIAGLVIFLVFLFVIGKELLVTLRKEKNDNWGWILYGFAISFFALVIYEIGIESVFSPFFWFFVGLIIATVKVRTQAISDSGTA